MVITLKAKNRQEGIKARAMRREGRIPATVYGPEIEATSLEVDAVEFRRIPFKEYTHIIQLEAEGKDAMDVLIRNVQKDFINGDVKNLEFYKVKPGHKLTTRVMLEFVGDSEAVKMGADLVTVHKEVHVRCLPRQIPYNVIVDLSKLEKDGDYLTFGDLEYGEGVECLDPAGEIVCKAETKRKDHAKAIEAEDAAAAEAAANEAAEGEAKSDEAKAE